MYNDYEDDPELLAAIEESLRQGSSASAMAPRSSYDDDLARAMAESLGEDYVRPADQTIFGSLYGNRYATREEELDRKASAQAYQAELEADHNQQVAEQYATKRVNRKQNMLHELAEKIENYANNVLKYPIDEKTGNKKFINLNRPEHKHILNEINKYNALAQNIRKWADRNASNNLKYTSDELISYANLRDVDLSAYDEFVDVFVPVDEDGYYSSGGRRKPRRKSRAKRGTKKQRKSRKSRR